MVGVKIPENNFGAVGGVPDAVPEAAGVDIPDAVPSSVPGLSIESICGDALKPLTDAQDQMNELTSSLQGPTELVDKLKGMGGAALPIDSVDSAKKAFDSFSETLKGIMDGDAKSLTPPGAGCLAGMWLSSIQKKLTSFSEELQSIVERVTGAPGKISPLFEGMKNDLGSTSELIGAEMEKLQKIPNEAADAIKSATSSPESLKGLPDLLGGIEQKATLAVGNVGNPLKSLQAVKDAVPVLVKQVEELIAELKGFLGSSPGKIAAAFKAPDPFGACLKGAGEAKEKLENGIKTATEAVDLAPLMDALSGLREQINGFDTDAIEASLQQFAKRVPEIFGPVIEAAKSASDMVEKAMPPGGQMQGGAFGKVDPAALDIG